MYYCITHLLICIIILPWSKIQKYNHVAVFNSYKHKVSSHLSSTLFLKQAEPIWGIMVCDWWLFSQYIPSLHSSKFLCLSTPKLTESNFFLMSPFAKQSLPPNRFLQHPLLQELPHCWNHKESPWHSLNQKPVSKSSTNFWKLWSSVKLTFPKR